MNISPTEAEEALAAIQSMMQKTRRAISSSGAYGFLVVWGIIWLLGFSGSQFLNNQIAGNIWIGLDILGGVISAFIGIRMRNSIRGSTQNTTGKRIGWFWLILFLFCGSAVAVFQPMNGKQLAMLIILFVMTGWVAMGLFFSSASVQIGVVITALALIGYFLLPGIFYLWMAILGGGGMVALGFFIRSRW